MLEKNSGAWLCAEPLVRCPAQTPVNINDEEAKEPEKGGKVDAKKRSAAGSVERDFEWWG